MAVPVVFPSILCYSLPASLFPPFPFYSHSAGDPAACCFLSFLVFGGTVWDSAWEKLLYEAGQWQGFLGSPRLP